MIDRLPLPPRLRTWLARSDLKLLLGAAASVLGALAFLKFGSEIAEGETFAFDEAILRALRRPGDPAAGAGPRWLPGAVRDVTALGSATVLVLVTAAVVGLLAVARKPRTAAFVAASTSFGAVASELLKRAYSRPRPEVVPRLVPVTTMSFPSGHSMNAAIVYLTLGALLAATTRDPRLRLYLLALALALTGLVGASRVYLGVHYPSDVLGGWAAGLAWALAWWAAARWVNARAARPLEAPDR